MGGFAKTFTSSPTGLASLTAAPFTGGLSLLAPATLFQEPPKQPNVDFPKPLSTDTGNKEAEAAAKEQKKRLQALAAGGQINTTRLGVLDEAPVARSGLLGQ